jgi:mono/diheme cytochrome c family protein
MKRHCGRVLFYSVAAASLFTSASNLRAQPTPAKVPPPVQAIQGAQVPQPVRPVLVAPAGDLGKYLKFDSEDKKLNVTNGTEQAIFTFSVTNISSEQVIIHYILGSCHCTVAQLPSSPWILAPRQVGEFHATMDVVGTPPGESKFKTLTVNSDKGVKVLNVTTTVLPDMSTPEARTNNVKMATADRQAVFKNADCVQCHVDTAKDSAGHDKMGQDLYAAVCGICHETTHRATFVPDLHHLKDPTSEAFWRVWITSGKPGTLMPAFAKSEGGILSSEQIDSLVKYLTASIPAQPAKLAPPGALRISQ